MWVDLPQHRFDERPLARAEYHLSIERFQGSWRVTACDQTLNHGPSIAIERRSLHRCLLSIVGWLVRETSWR